MRRILLRLVSLMAVLDGPKPIVEDMPKTPFPQAPRGPRDNPAMALHELLRLHPDFQIDADIPNKLIITVAQDGYLRHVAV